MTDDIVLHDWNDYPGYHRTWLKLNRGKPYQIFDWQLEHLHKKVDAGCKRIVLACGRRSGKSTATIAEVAREVTKPPEEVFGIMHSPIVYIVGSTSEASMRVWEPVWEAFVPSDDGSYQAPLSFLHAGHEKQRGVIFIKGGARIYRKTADDPRSLQGERVTLVVTDESHDINEEAWQNVMPALLDSGGRLIALGVTKGKGRFRSYWHRGQGADSQFYSASAPTSANPVILQRAREAGMEVEAFIRSEAEEDLTDDEFARQYLAEWREEEGQVFSNFEQYFKGSGYPLGEDKQPVVGPGPHIMSLDLGKLHDYTVAYVGDVARQQIVARLRFNKLDYMDQVPQIAAMFRQYNCRFIHMDATGVGEGPSEMLRRPPSAGGYGCSVIPFKFTNESKQGLVSTMVREVQRGNVTFLADDETLKKEMGLFEGLVSPGGVVKYSAPVGFFDDCVISAALLIQKMARNKSMAANPIHKPYATFSTSGSGKSHIPPLPRPRPKEAIAA